MSQQYSQMLKGILEGCVLEIISEGNIYGYELSVRIAEKGLHSVSEGSIYPLLLRMEKEHLIEGVFKESPNGPKRKYYFLTEKGISELKDFKERWIELKKAVDAILCTGGDTSDAE